MKQSVYLGEFVLATLAGGEKGRANVDLAPTLISAIRLYLNDRDSDRPGWPYPGFLTETEMGGEVKLELEIEEDLWSAFEREAGKQGVTVSQLANHAAFYTAAELSSGRLTRRIADDLEDEGG